MANVILLQSLRLKNFKGIKDFTLDLAGRNTSIYADNGVGKTTLYDAFLWVLFDKDSANKKDFSVKTLDSTGAEIHGLEHEVEAILTIDGAELKLRKMFSEVWRKKKGEANKQFTGHETNYWIDDVPAKKAEYLQKINSIIDEGIFKLLTNPFYFNTQISWQDRRNTLLEIAGDISDTDVIASDSKLIRLTEILAGKSTDNYRKILNERLKMLNEEIEKIPVRIDELTKTLVIDEVDYAAIELAIEEHMQTMQEIEAELATGSQAAATYRDKQQQAFKLQNDLKARKKELDSQAGASIKPLIEEKFGLDSAKYRLEGEVKLLNNQIQDTEALVQKANAQMLELRAQWSEENAKAFIEPNPDNFVCPTCGQYMPASTKEQKITELKANFESTKSQALSGINSLGKALKEQVEQAKVEIEELSNKRNLTEANLGDVNERLAELVKEIQAEQSRQGKPDYEADPIYKSIKAKLQALQEELERPVEDSTAELWSRKHQVTEKIDSLKKVLNNKDVAERTRTRIDELKADERKLAAQYSEMEGEKYLLDQFIKRKVNLLEGSINNRFKSVRFKLFEVLINGAVNEVCETLVNTNGAWVPFNSNANHAGQINAGIDIINTLANHYGVSVPIFVDNAEAVNELAETKGQVIRLVVSTDKQLRVEVA